MLQLIPYTAISPASQRQRSPRQTICAGLFLVLASLLLTACAGRLGSNHPDAPCTQFVHNRYPFMPPYDQFVRWSREERDTLTVGAEHDTPLGRLILYQVRCPAEAATDGMTLSGFYLMDTPPGRQHTVIAQDVSPELTGAPAIQHLTSRNLRPDGGSFITYILGHIRDPAVKTIEATLDIGEVVSAMQSEHTFIILVEGQYAACEIRALDDQGTVLAQINRELPPGDAICPTRQQVIDEGN